MKRTTISAVALVAALFGLTSASWATHPHDATTGATGAYGQAPRSATLNQFAMPRQSSSPYDVFSYDGRYRGRDPDPNVRLQLLLDDASIY